MTEAGVQHRLSAMLPVSSQIHRHGLGKPRQNDGGPCARGFERGNYIYSQSALGLAVAGHLPLSIVLLFFCVVSVALAGEDVASIQADFLKGDYSVVVSKTEKLLAGGSSRADQDDLLYLNGLSELKMGNVENATKSLGRLADEFPNSRWTSHAKELIKNGEFNFSVQIGAFEKEENAARLKLELDRRGFQSSIDQSVMGGRPFYRVKVGQFASRQQAEEEAQHLRQAGFPSKIVP